MLKLSDAILFGDSLKIANGAAYLCKNSDGEITGCALGGALLACGVSLDDFGNKGAVSRIMAIWPWLGEADVQKIGTMYSMSVHGHIYTIEQIADYVRSIEPAEEPENQEPPEDDRDVYSSIAVMQDQYFDKGVK